MTLFIDRSKSLENDDYNYNESRPNAYRGKIEKLNMMQGGKIQSGASMNIQDEELQGARKNPHTPFGGVSLASRGVR